MLNSIDEALKENFFYFRTLQKFAEQTVQGGATTGLNGDQGTSSTSMVGYYFLGLSKACLCMWLYFI